MPNRPSIASSSKPVNGPRSLRLLSGLMIVTIIALTAFQLYWLKENFDREKRLLDLKTDKAFRQSLLQLQASKIRFDAGLPGDSVGRRADVKVFMTEGHEVPAKDKLPPPELISSINMIRDRTIDSAARGKTRMIISLNNTTVRVAGDSAGAFPAPSPGPGLPENKVIRLVYGVDSLQDSLRVPEIDSAVAAGFRRDKIRLPFNVILVDSAVGGGDFTMNQVTIGLAQPRTYRLETGNATGYLLMRITQPILFSLLLIGITVLSFLLLYRSLLRQRRLAELKNEFISNITHELKTPIATVGVAIEALKNFNALQDPERTREYLDISAQELQRLGLLVDKVLKLSMFEKQEMELRPEPLNLQELVNEVVASLRLQLEKRHATVAVTTLGDTRLTGDRLHLLSVIFNLLDNALKYSGNAPDIKVHVSASDDQVVLQVSDSGIGIPAEYQQKVFEKFFRVPHGDTHDAKGYGLGLSYVAQVVSKHRGTISLESQPDKGSRFSITLPKSFAV